MRVHTPEEQREFWERCRKDEPRWWIRREVRQLQELLQIHVALGLESGTPTDRIIEHLRRVRRAVVVVTNHNGEG